MRWPWRKKKPATRCELVLRTTLALPNEEVTMSQSLAITASCWEQSACQEEMLELAMRRMAKSYYRQIERRRGTRLTRY